MYIYCKATTGEAHSSEPGERPSQLLILLSVGRGSVDAGAYRRCRVSHAQLWVYYIIQIYYTRKSLFIFPQQPARARVNNY